MTEQELDDYGKGIHIAYSTENPASYTPRAGVTYYAYEVNPPKLTPKKADQETTLENQKPIKRPIIISRPEPEPSTHKQVPFLYPIIILLQRLIPRIR